MLAKKSLKNFKKFEFNTTIATFCEKFIYLMSFLIRLYTPLILVIHSPIPLHPSHYLAYDGKSIIFSNL